MHVVPRKDIKKNKSYQIWFKSALTCIKSALRVNSGRFRHHPSVAPQQQDRTELLLYSSPPPFVMDVNGPLTGRSTLTAAWDHRDGFVSGFPQWHVQQHLGGGVWNFVQRLQGMPSQYFSLPRVSVSIPSSGLCWVIDRCVQSTEAEGFLWHTSECTSRSGEPSGPLPLQNPWLPAVTQSTVSELPNYQPKRTLSFRMTQEFIHLFYLG